MKLAKRTRSAPGFTLVELLVVLTIIVVLLALSGAAYQKAADSQRGRSTDDLMNRLQPALDAEYDAVVKQCARDRQLGTNQTYLAVLAWCGDPDRAQAIWTNANLRRQFPQTLMEVATGATVPVCPTVTPLPVLKTFSSLSGLSAPTTNPDFESAALLYVILSKKSAGGSGGFAADDVTNGMQMDVGLGGGTARVFRDAWGNPICFHLWWQGVPGTASWTEVQSPPYVDGKASAGCMDPLDPLGTATAAFPSGTPRVFGWSNTTNQQTMMGAPYYFTGQNRIATVWSYGRNLASDNLLPGSDDRGGFRLRRLGTTGGN